jgi:hypothetical protein
MPIHGDDDRLALMTPVARREWQAELDRFLFGENAHGLGKAGPGSFPDETPILSARDLARESLRSRELGGGHPPGRSLKRRHDTSLSAVAPYGSENSTIQVVIPALFPVLRSLIDERKANRRFVLLGVKRGQIVANVRMKTTVFGITIWNAQEFLQ